MKEIDRERDKLRKEKEEYESYFHNKKKEEALSCRKALVGKCFITRYIPDNNNSYIKAFKIIDVLDNPNERNAECVVLIDGTRSSCWNEYGVQFMKLGLWVQNQFRLMNRPNDPKMIDYYREISQGEFNELYDSYKQSLDDKAY